MKYTTGVATLFLVAACGCRGEPQRETSPIDSGVIDGSEPAVERWRTMDLTDAFGNSSAYAAQSLAATAVFAMRPPYDRVQAWLMVECDEAWIRFSQDTEPDWWHSIGRSTGITSGRCPLRW